MIHRVKTPFTESISAFSIKNLIEGKIAAIRIKEFCSKDVAQEVSTRLCTCSDIGQFNKASEIGRIGMAHFEIDSPKSQQIYHDTASINTERLRNFFSPYLSPIDKLRVVLEEAWPAGAALETIDGRKCFAGICRIMEPSVELLAHNDRLERDSPHSPRAKSLIGQLSACVYLQVPKIGGGLRLWMKGPASEQEYIELKGNSYGISMDKLGPPLHIIEPEQGELVIFNTNQYHGVAPGQGYSRINVGLFIGYRGDELPLSYWS